MFLKTAKGTKVTQPCCPGLRLSSKSVKARCSEFMEHPASVGESYTGHLVQAGGFGWRMIRAGFACWLHGLFPFLCVTSGSDTVQSLHAEMSARRERALRGVVVR